MLVNRPANFAAPFLLRSYFSNALATILVAISTGLIATSAANAETDVGGSTNKAAQALFTQALQKYNDRDYQTASELYTKAIAIDSKYAKAFANRGFCRFYLHDYSGSLEDLDFAVHFFPDNASLKEIREKDQAIISEGNNAAVQQERIANARRMLLQAQLGGDPTDPGTMIMMRAQRLGLLNGNNALGANRFTPNPGLANQSQSLRSGTNNPFSVHSTAGGPMAASANDSPFAVTSGPPTQPVAAGNSSPFAVTAGAPTQPVANSSSTPFAVTNGAPTQAASSAGDTPFGVTSGAPTTQIASSSISNGVPVHPPVDTMTAKDHYQRGCEKNKAQDFAAAIPEFSRSIELDPTFGDCFANRGLARFHTKDYNGALQDFVSADRLIPNNAELKRYIQLCHQMGAQ